MKILLLDKIRLVPKRLCAVIAELKKNLQIGDFFLEKLCIPQLFFERDCLRK